MKLSDYAHTPPVASLMTPFPHFIEADESLERISKLMEEHSIGHIPVKRAGTVVGVVSHSAVTTALRCSTGAHGEVRASDIHSHQPCVVEFSAPLSEALRGMAGQHADAAVVLKDGKLAGIVTATDVCDALSQILEDRFPATEGVA